MQRVSSLPHRTGSQIRSAATRWFLAFCLLLPLLALAAAGASLDSPLSLDDTDDDIGLALWQGAAVLGGLITALALLGLPVLSERRPPPLHPPQRLSAN